MKLTADKRRTVVVRLQAAGIPIPTEDHAATGSDLLVESLQGSLAFDLKMGSEYLLNLRISNNSYGNLMIKKLRGHLLDEDRELTFQGDPREHDPERKTYPMLSGRSVSYDSVLNHRLGTEIAPGTCIEGTLLALSVTLKIPGEYLHGQFIPFVIILTDQYRRKHRSVVEVSVDRTATMSKPKVFSRRARSLYHGGSPRSPEFDQSLTARQSTAKGNAGKTVEQSVELDPVMKRIAAIIQQSELDSMLDE